MPQNASSILGMQLTQNIGVERIHHINITAQAPGIYHPDPKEFAASGMRSGCQAAGGTTIFASDESAIIWSLAMPPDLLAQNPQVEIRRLSDGVIVERMSAFQAIVGAHRGFPYYVDGGFDINLTQIGSFSLSWSRVSGRGV